MGRHINEKEDSIQETVLSPLIIPAVAVTITLCYASLLDIRERRVPFRTWYPMLAIGLPFTAFFYGFLIFMRDYSHAWYLIVMTLAFALLFYLFAYFHLFGGADAWALIFIALCLPTFPFTPLFGIPPLALFPFSVLVNAVILNLLTPVGIYLYNLKEGNRAPFPYRFLAYPVDGDQIDQSYGYIVEEIAEEEGVMTRRFVRVRDAIRGMTTGNGRVYTADLRRKPDEYRNERDLYRKAGRVWISYGVPFIVPITAGVITSLIFGDIIFYLLQVLYGV